MTKFLKWLIIFIIGAAIISFAISLFAAFSLTNTVKNALYQLAFDFDSCAALGYPVAESYPRQCAGPDGKSFVENIGNAIEKADLIRATSPKPGTTITSPLTIEGEARGTWYFEASFPIKLLDSTGTEIATGHAEAQGDPATGEVNWMTEDFVPFKATLEFTAPEKMFKGTLVLQKDNPSGLPEHDDKLEIPIRFPIKQIVSEPKACKPTGCGGQVCSDEDVITTCEYLPQYSCYKNAVCERQATNECGWTETPELKACLD